MSEPLIRNKSGHDQLRKALESNGVVIDKVELADGFGSWAIYLSTEPKIYISCDNRESDLR